MRRIGTLLLFTAIAAHAQRPARPEIPRLSEVVDVTVVNLDVVVTDRAGHRVHGLTKDDFEVREGGKLQTITNFAEYRGAGRGAESARVEGPAGAAAAPRPRRTLVIAIEQQTLLPFRRDDWFAALGKFVDDVMQPGDQAMVVSLYPLASMRVRQAMTGDREAVHAALNKVAKELVRLPGADDAADARQEIAEREELNEDPERQPIPATLPGEVCAVQRMVGVRRKATAIGALMNSMGAVEGRKILLLATYRFGANVGIECGVAGSEYKTDRIREELVRTANANGFTIYPMNPSTSQPPVAGAASHAPVGDWTHGQAVFLNENESLMKIADQTGGEMGWGPDIVKLLPLIAEDLDAYYSLGYRGDGQKTDRARSVVVTTKRKDLKVRARAQVIEKSEETRMRERVIAALSYVADPGRLTPRVTTGAVTKQGRNRFTLPIKVEVPIGQLTTIREGDAHRGAFSLFIGGGNREVLFSDVTQRTQVLTIPPSDLERAKQGHYTYEVDLTIDGKVNRIAVGVYDEVGRDYGVVRIDVKRRNREGMD